jgi:hypothetical protein
MKRLSLVAMLVVTLGLLPAPSAPGGGCTRWRKLFGRHPGD